MEQITLHYNAVNKDLLELLQALMSNPCLNSFYLVGGTALALQIGHRESVDINLFSKEPFDERIKAENLKHQFHPQQIELAENSLSLIINKLKIDIITHAYPWLSDPVIEDKLRLASLKDIAAMKLNAISGRGLKKDYVDIYFLLERYTLPEMINLFKLKYSDGSDWYLIRALADIDSADMDDTPISNCLEPDWDKIKTTLKRAVKRLL